MDAKWHRINFKIKFGSPTDPRFYIDLIIIDLLLKPVLKQLKSQFRFWGFHKGVDQTGHVLEFRIYTTPEIATKVLTSIKSNSHYQSIRDNYLDTEANLELIGSEEQAKNIETVADGKWPPEVRRTWAHYIMGACEMYLGLIEEVQRSISNQDDLEEYYRVIEQEINQKWHDYGWHAYLHHLGAVFSYSISRATLRHIAPHDKHFDFIL